MKTVIALVTIVTSMAFANQPATAPASATAPAAQNAPAVQGQNDKLAAAPAVEAHKATAKKAKKVKKH